ncbi:MAG: site-2 protease family protein [bacterium]|nr:site-2 protease family protein [bacterium]
MTIARIFGIPVRVDGSWLLVFAFFVWALGAPEALFPSAQPSARFMFAAFTVLGLFACVVVHEFAHALVARRFGATIREIELFAFGGVSRIDGADATPWQEAAVAFVGPLASVALGVLIAFAALAAGDGSPVYRALAYLAAMNVMLAAFNLLPSYPLDGSRVLHALIWALSKRRSFAVTVISATSSIIAALLVAASLALFFSGAVAAGIWTAFLAWFIMRAARSETTNELFVTPLAALRCSQIADEVPDAIEPDTTCAHALSRMIATRRRALPITIGGTLAGLVTLSDFAKLDGRDPSSAYVGCIMTPARLLVAVEPGLGALEAFRRLSDCGFHQLPVLDGGTLVGFISGETFHRALTFAREERAIVPRALHAAADRAR